MRNRGGCGDKIRGSEEWGKRREEKTEEAIACQRTKLVYSIAYTASSTHEYPPLE